MKRKLLVSLAGLIAVSGFGLYAGNLEPMEWSIGGVPFYKRLGEVRASFASHIDVNGGPAYVRHQGGDVVAEGSLAAETFFDNGILVITFQEMPLLPAGFSYELVVPAGSVCATSDPSVTNDELKVEFDIPDTLPAAIPDLQDGAVVTSSQFLSFSFPTEIEAVEGSEVILTRKGVDLLSYPCSASWDWNLGTAGMSLDSPMYFEDGVEYSLRLPAGSVRSIYRPEVTNTEAVMKFMGGYTEPIPPLNYSWCSLFGSRPSDSLGEVIFYYDQPILLCMDPCVELWSVEPEERVLQVAPTLREEDGRWLLVADFGGYEYEPGIGYTVLMPEGTVVAADGTSSVNPRNSISVDNSGVDGLTEGKVSVRGRNGSISVAGLPEGAAIAVYTLDGRLAARSSSTGKVVSFTGLVPGTYVVLAQAKAYKVAI